MMILITPYQNPDLDGTACVYAYAEFLNKTGRKAIAALFGEPHREAQFVMEQFSIPAFENAEFVVDDCEGVILVDASDLGGLSGKIKVERVIEIIDHRKVHEADKFPNAKVHIELVGSAATLIAEKFHTENIDISKESAALLYSAIVSNTINFQANVTTHRDHKMADWLQEKFTLPKNYIRNMFSDKSQFKKSLKETVIGDFATFQFNGQHLGIAQLEIVDVSSFVENNLSEIRTVLKEIQKEQSLDLICMTVIDLEKAFNKLVVLDTKIQTLLEDVLKINFVDGVAQREGILMRKEIVPLIKDHLIS
jgi:manganese-dependent inorganic pyrophosphatase